MTEVARFLAVDFGAESGRVLQGELANDKLTLRDVHRFPNGPVRVLDRMHWDILRLFQEVKTGLKQALREADWKIDGIGVDTWGVDFGLLGDDGELLGNPVHYRDERTNGVPDKLWRTVPKNDLWRRTGIQFMQINSVYQLYSMVLSNTPALKQASTFLMIGDLINYWLTGRKVCEFSNATTSQCYNPTLGDWDKGLLNELGIPSDIFPEIVQPGAHLGTLTTALVHEMNGNRTIPVYAPCTHDTGSAVAAVPAIDEDFICLSSGTWSIMGVEIRKPIITNEALLCNFTNEGGVDGTFRFLRNIMGLWLVQECRRTWLAAGEDVSYGQLVSLAEQCAGFVSVVDPDNPAFLPPGDMPTRIQDECRRTGQRVPESKGEIVRCALDSLALKYKQTVENIDRVIGKKMNTIHIVGGGTQNRLLCQITADATGRRVLAGPIEATAVGNILVQAMGAGIIGSLAEARAIVRNSFDPAIYEPREVQGMSEAFSRIAD